MKRLFLILFICHAVAIIFLFHEVGYRVNFTDSMPHGLYQIVPGKPVKGDLVTFTLSEDNPYFQISLARNYLGLNNHIHFLKVLAGTEGDIIKISNTGVSVNGVLLPRSKQKTSDCYGRNLPALLHSTIIPAAKCLAMSTYNVNSFDGRYFGLIDIKRMQRVIPVFTINPEDKNIAENTCPKCGSSLIHITPTKKYESRWFCRSYPSCHYWTLTPHKKTESLAKLAQPKE